MSGVDHPWEESRGMGVSYGYNRTEDLNIYHMSRELVFILVDTVSRGGNLLLDIGPKADGTIPVIMEERLTQMGDWLKINGEAISGTEAGLSIELPDLPEDLRRQPKLPCKRRPVCCNPRT
jgi:alpha-L-fucosidase